MSLRRHGSCIRLYDLLAGTEETAGKLELIHELGPKGITVLHKGVKHGCVKLVKYILVDIFDSDGKCICSFCGADGPCVLTREGLLRKTSEYGSTAVNMAVVSGSPKMVLLLKWAIDVSDMCKKRGLPVENSCMKPREFYRNWCLQQERHRSREKSGSGGEVAKETGVHMEVPDVKDDAIGRNIYGTDVIDVLILKVYDLIEKKLNENWGDDQEVMDMLKGICKKHVDVEFVPIAHIFLHFLSYLNLDSSHQMFGKKLGRSF